MCLQIDNLRINGSVDGDGRNSPKKGKRWLEIRRERVCEWEQKASKL